ncbi:hypothetical protein BDR26DRAFT_852716 [Obelidium mucronatum]|nr:hypothetical protein BDR26DRAFT_852716 [Obelidium mucronatum]
MDQTSIPRKKTKIPVRSTSLLRFNKPALASIPSFIIESIFKWIQPTHVQRYRHLCRLISLILSTPHFALLNITQFNHLYEYTESKGLDVIWFRAPNCYQTAYALLNEYSFQRIESINFEYPPPPKTNDNQTRSIIDGRIPIELGTHFPALTYLNLANNRFHSSIPSTLGHFYNTLTRIDLSRNRLDGCIPSQLGSLKHLLSLNLSHNWLVGRIPASLAHQLASLQDLDLSFNRLIGPIPSEFEKLRSLVTLRVNDNLLWGEIPYGLSLCTNLETLWVHNNRITGTVPVEFMGLTRLVEFVVKGNRMSGYLPLELGGMRALEVFWWRNGEAGARPVVFEELGTYFTQVDVGEGCVGDDNDESDSASRESGFGAVWSRLFGKVWHT